MSSLSERAGFLIAANLIKYAVGFVMPMVLVRFLSQSDYGTYQQLNLIGTTAIGILVLGLPTSIYYFYNQFSDNRVPALIAQTSLMLVFSGGACIAILYLGAPPLAAKFGNDAIAMLLPLYAFSVAFMIASEHSLSFMIAQNRYVTAVGFETGETFGRVTILLVPLLLGYGLNGLIIGMLIYAITRFLARSIYLFYGSGIQFKGWSTVTFARDQLVYSFPLALASLSALLGGAFNRGIVATSFSPADYAIYSVGALEIPLDVIFQASVANVLRASLPQLVREGRKEEMGKILREAMRKLSIIVLPSFVFLLGHSHQFITLLFTSRYEESVVVFRIYLWLIPLHMLVLSLIPQVFGRTKWNLYVMWIQTLVLVGASYALLKLVGFYGPALAGVGTAYLTAIIYFVIAIRLTGCKFLELVPTIHIIRVIIVALFAVFFSRLSLHWLPLNLLGFAGTGIVFSIIFLVAAPLFKIFTNQDISFLKRSLGKALRRGKA